MIIKGYPEGSDITILNATYKYPKKDEESGKWDDGSIDIVYRDNLTGEKKLEHIINPDYLMYTAKDNVLVEHWNFYLPIEQVDKHYVPFKDLEKYIAEFTGNLDFFYNNINNGNRRANKMLHTAYNVMNSDMQIEDHYRLRFAQEYTNNIFPLKKAFFDIEADTINIKGDFPELGEAPVNAVTLIDMDSKTAFVLLLRNPENPLIQEFEDSCDQTMIDELANFVIKNVGGWKEATRKGVIDLRYNFRFYDEEINLIIDLFKIINTLKPDFLMAWNMSFDLPTLIERCKILGYDPKEIMCHPDFPNKYISYYIDERNKNDFEERGDFCEIAGYTVPIDQMIQFASRRKGQSKFISYGLDAIGEAVAKVKKYDYKHITTSIAKLPYLDYKTFVFYNIMDVIVQVCIEAKTADIDYIFSKCVANNTRLQKGHRQTVYLANRGIYEFYKNGFIMGNNVNKFNEKPESKYSGAFVSRPDMLTDDSKMKINGRPMYLFENLDDFDYARLYPSILMEDNIAPHTQIGKIEIPNRVFDGDEQWGLERYPREMVYCEDLHSHHWISFGNRWFGLANYEDLYDQVIEYYTQYKNSNRSLYRYNDEGLIIPVHMKPIKNELINPVSFQNKDELRKVVSFTKPRNNEFIDKLKSDIEGRIPNVKE